MATAVLRSHDALANTMHLDAFAASPIKPRRRRHAKAGSPPPKTAVPAVSSSPPKQAQAPVASSPPKAPAAGRRSPPAKPARKQPSPSKEAPAKPPQMVVRILKRGEEPPAPAPVPAPVQPKAQAPPADRRVRSPSPPSAAPVQARAQAPPADRRVRSPSPASPPVPARAPRVLGFTARIGPQAPAVVPTKRMVSVAAVAANAATYAGPAFSVAAPEPSSLPVPGFLQRAEEEATRGLRCLLRIGELS
ncbi:skin secretory protein xP2-like [Lolium rigidum]|uniref:skin secretory protein xP2-like n=1 Tax=Lolium rigidum TaxID=89674 RepID=UPI001F5CD74D|nr:skin secretory protein xP2-like [Lolium rigidum]